MMLMQGGGHAGREVVLFPSPAGDIIEGEPVGIAGEAERVDTDAAEELFRTAYPKLAGWVRRLVDDDDTAHEIASEAFVRLLGRWTRVDSPQSYLYMIATNLVRDHWRKTERERRAIRSVTAGAAVEEATFPDQDVDVRNLIASLPLGCVIRFCCTTTPASRSRRSRPCCTGPRARSRRTCSPRAPG